MHLSEEERAIAEGASGDGAGMAMRILAGAAQLMGAPRLIPIASAHIDGALYHGDSGTLFAEKLANAGAKTRVRATLNVGALDLACGTRTRLPPHEHAMAKRLMLAHEAMGCEPSWTCAPYQAGHRPAKGSDVAWGESNAVAFCNSVLGARTNRYGDFLDICCAILGRAPDYGLHRPENRLARLLIDCSGLSEALRRSDVFWPVFGSWYGRTVGNTIGVVKGLEGFTSEDRLKALGAAAASTGAVALFHVAGVTPEAATLEEALGGRAPQERIVVTPQMLREAGAGLSTTQETGIDAVAVGSPHLSAAELLQLDAFIAGRKLKIPFYACTGRHALAEIAPDGARSRLEKAGVTLVADTCVVVTPILKAISGVLMTNSGKFAHYAPGNTGYAVQYGALADCVESAVTGRLSRQDTVWQ